MVVDWGVVWPRGVGGRLASGHGVVLGHNYLYTSTQVRENVQLQWPL